jgi:alkyl hydroperoxide reductase subunit AhpC
MVTLIGQKVPEMTVDALMPNGAIGKINLKDYQGKWLVLFFYPLDFTFV